MHVMFQVFNLRNTNCSLLIYVVREVSAVCNVHRELVDMVDLSRLAEKFAGISEIRRNIFGNWKNVNVWPTYYVLTQQQY
jgi:hypothetical protein